MTLEMTLKDALAAVRDGPCDLADMMCVQEAAHVLKAEVKQLLKDCSRLSNAVIQQNDAAGLVAEVKRLRAELRATAQTIDDLVEEAFRAGYESGLGDYGHNEIDIAWQHWKAIQ